MCGIVGYSEVELLLRTFQDVTHPDDLPAVYSAFMEGLQARREYIVEARLRNSATYDYEWFLFKAAPRILANGAFTGFIGTAVNIHQQKVLLAEMEARVARFHRLVPRVALQVAHIIREIEYEGIRRNFATAIL